jgi:hypothetical protein
MPSDHLGWLGKRIGQKSPFQEVPPALIADLKSRLNSGLDVERRLAVHEFCLLGIAPIAPLKCWPKQECSNLQLAAAEALLREWLDYVEEYPEASEKEIINTLFPRDGEYLAGTIKPRLRRLANSDSPPNGMLAKKLAAWSERVKEVLLNWDVRAEPDELADSEGQDCPLAPLDKEKFLELTRAKLSESWHYVTELLGDARTDYELVAAEKAIQQFLSTLKWEAIAVALELRDPYGEPITSREVRELAGSIAPPCEPTTTEAKPTRDWVSKYRRMRAAGL